MHKVITVAAVMVAVLAPFFLGPVGLGVAVLIAVPLVIAITSGSMKDQD